MNRRHVVLIGVDGLQYERLEGLLSNCNDKDGYSNFLMFRGFCGGYSKTQTQQDTVSSPGWTTILTGVWLWKHHVPKNNPKLISAVPSVFNRIHDHSKESKSIRSPPRTFSLTGMDLDVKMGRSKDMLITHSMTWDVINQNLCLTNDTITEAEVLQDSAAINRAVEIILHDENPTFIFIHLDEIDEAGHSNCFGAKYDQCVLESDEQIGQICRAIQRRTQRKHEEKEGKGDISSISPSSTSSIESYEVVKRTPTTMDYEEEWMVMVVTDHGRDSYGWNHGRQTETEKTIFYGFWFHNMIQQQDMLDNLEKRSHQGGDILSEKGYQIPFSLLYAYPPQTCVAPTILSFLNIDIEKEWLLDGRSLLDSSDPPSIDCAFVHASTIYWGVSRRIPLQKDKEEKTSQANALDSDTKDSNTSVNNSLIFEKHPDEENVKIIIHIGDNVLEEMIIPYELGKWKLQNHPPPGAIWNIELKGPGGVTFWTRIEGQPLKFGQRLLMLLRSYSTC